MAGRVKKAPGHADRLGCGGFGIVPDGGDYQLQRRKVAKGGAWKNRFVPNISRFPFGCLFVFLVVLLVKLFAELAPAVTAHPGLVLVDAIGNIRRGMDVIVGDKEVPAECLGKEHQ
jgi:hypothetical protein